MVMVMERGTVSLPVEIVCSDLRKSARVGVERDELIANAGPGGSIPLA
jgi:hypothetical protein